jgi:hypothetical protein
VQAAKHKQGGNAGYFYFGGYSLRYLAHELLSCIIY